MAGHIYAFINELSFEGQYAPMNVGKGLLHFLRSCNRVKDIGKQNYSIMYTASVYQKEVTYGVTYASALKTMTGDFKDEILLLKMNMDRSGWEKLDDSGYFLDPNEKYSVGSRDVSNSSLAEAFEYDGLAAAEDGVLVVNMPESSFGTVIDVKKKTSHLSRSLNAVNSEQETIAFLQSKGFTAPYDRNSTKRPLPEQTILRDTSLFAKTQRKNMGAYLYERIGHDELWCLDTLHVDGAAHFEIFSMADDKWKGECYDLQNIAPDYQSKKHEGSKIRD